jgi:hypothetical protein
MKTTKASKRHEKRQSQVKWQEELRKAQKSKKSSKQGKSAKLALPLKSTPPNTLNARSPP